MNTATKIKTSWLKNIRKGVEVRPPSMVIVGPAGVGKSSLAGNIPKSVVMPFGQEDTWGLLKSSGAVPEDLPVLPQAKSFSDMMEMLEALHGLHRLYDVDKVVNSPRFSSTSSDTENGWTP